MPDATKTYMHVHKSWIAGSEARFRSRCRRWSGERETEREREIEREKESASEREREIERGRYQLYSGTYQLRTFFPHPSSASLWFRLTYLSISASHSASQAGKRRTESRLPTLVWPLTRGSSSAVEGSADVDVHLTNQLPQKTRGKWPI